MEQVFAADRKPFHKKCLTCQAAGCMYIHKHQGYNICGKCYSDIYRPREFLAEGEETAAERRARLAREAEERERRRLAGEEEMMKQEMADAKEFKFSFLKVAETVGIAPGTSYGL